MCFKCYNKWAMNGWNNVIWQGREGTSTAFKIDTGTKFAPCMYHAAANTVVTSFMNYTFLGAERIWQMHTGKHKELFVKQEVFIDFFFKF